MWWPGTAGECWMRSQTFGETKSLWRQRTEMTIRRGQDAHREEESKDLAEMNNEEPDFW